MQLEDRKRLCEELEVKDTLLYNKLFGHLKDKVKEEVDASDPRRDRVLGLISDPYCQVPLIDEELKRECGTMIPAFYKSLEGLDNSIRFELMLSLAHTYVSTFQDEYLSYMKDGLPFDWNDFEKSWNEKPGAEKINSILGRAISTLRN